MRYTTVIKDASRQVIGRVASGLSGLLVTGMLTPLLGPLRFSDYSTILTFFAFWSAFADLGLYSMGLRELGKLKTELGITDVDSYRQSPQSVQHQLSLSLSQFVRSRLTQIAVVYSIVLVCGYMIGSYLHNPYIARGLPIGMLFSALFMAAGIIQLPLQLFWKMHHVSIALILARISQILFLLFVLYSGLFSFDLTLSEFPLSLFLLVLGSVLISSLTQTIYTLIMSNRIVPLRQTPYFRHMIGHIIHNGWYGLASVFNSFHLLIVGFLISLFYPTLQGFAYVGIWGLALQLIQVLLIIPASLANSVLHKISGATHEAQSHGFGRLLLIVTRCAGLFFSNFMIFASHIISTISGPKYLSSTGGGWNINGLHMILSSSDIFAPGVIGSDMVLACLGAMLMLTFGVTVYNYIFIAAGKQKALFPINATSTLIGLLVSLVVVSQYSILGGIGAMIVMELCFLVGSIWSARRYRIAPRFSTSQLIFILLFFFGISCLGFFFPIVSYTSISGFILTASLYNILVFVIRYRSLKSYFKSMTDVITHTISEDKSESYF